MFSSLRSLLSRFFSYVRSFLGLPRDICRLKLLKNDGTPVIDQLYNCKRARHILHRMAQGVRPKRMQVHYTGPSIQPRHRSLEREPVNPFWYFYWYLTAKEHYTWDMVVNDEATKIRLPHPPSDFNDMLDVLDRGATVENIVVQYQGQNGFVNV